jgi:ubiquitin carboxyl-terminal hydrolase 7
LRRFEYDILFDRNVKINSRFEFPTEIDLGRFLAADADKSKSQVYDLYGILVHSGGVSGGHYYAYLRTSVDSQWFEFNDSYVRKVDPERAIEANFGGQDSARKAAGGYVYERAYSAYFLVYVRKEDAADIFGPIVDESIPKHLRDFIANPEPVDLEEATELTVYPVDDCLRHNCLSRTPGFSCPEVEKRSALS